MLTDELLKKYNVQTLKTYREMYPQIENNELEISYYKAFLLATDYIPNKIMESQIMAIDCKDYSEELAARQFCREQINKLRNSSKEEIQNECNSK